MITKHDATKIIAYINWLEENLPEGIDPYNEFVKCESSHQKLLDTI